MMFQRPIWSFLIYFISSFFFENCVVRQISNFYLCDATVQLRHSPQSHCPSEAVRCSGIALLRPCEFRKLPFNRHPHSQARRCGCCTWRLNLPRWLPASAMPLLAAPVLLTAHSCSALLALPQWPHLPYHGELKLGLLQHRFARGQQEAVEGQARGAAVAPRRARHSALGLLWLAW